MPIGLGCMRLSTAPDRDEARAEAVIHAALDAGATLLDTAGSYGHGAEDTGHNERLVAQALRSWSGDRTRIEVATKGGLIRPRGAWVPAGKAKDLRAGCEASLRALGVEAIDLYQLHAVDPDTPIETSVRALAVLQAEGLVRRIGLCNVTVGQVEAARRIAEVASVQVSLSPLDDENLRNGVAEYCRDHGIRLIAYRPLGGDRRQRLARDPVLASIAAELEATAEEVTLAWLLGFGPLVVPIPGATRPATARSLGRALRLALLPRHLDQLDGRFRGRLLRVPRERRRPPAGAPGEVVIVMGMPGAGKSTLVTDFEARGYSRLNRDVRGGSLRGLVPLLDAGLAGGRRHWVLDNTYPSRASRNEVIECAWRHGVGARCVWVTTGIADAQVNAITRMLDAHGRLPRPEEIRERGQADSRFFGPDAQFRYERILEPPVADEGFTAIEQRPFTRQAAAGAGHRAVILEYDDVLVPRLDRATPALRQGDVTLAPGRRETLARYRAEGWLLFASAWRPQVASGEVTAGDVAASFDRARELLGLDIALACCPHAAGPPVCWCRKPLPGLVLEFARRDGVGLGHSVSVGRAPADRTLAQRLGLTYHDAEVFFAPARP
jgi:aryl-alcohol dehydrogenase-like predicted oxidoreductase